MDLVEAIRKVLIEIREAANDGRLTIREAIEIAVAIGELLRVIGQILPGMAQGSGNKV